MYRASSDVNVYLEAHLHSYWFCRQKVDPAHSSIYYCWIICTKKWSTKEIASVLLRCANALPTITMLTHITFISYLFRQSYKVCRLQWRQSLWKWINCYLFWALNRKGTRWDVPDSTALMDHAYSLVVQYVQCTLDWVKRTILVWKGYSAWVKASKEQKLVLHWGLLCCPFCPSHPHPFTPKY